MQQIDLFEVAVGLPFLVDQNGKARYRCVTDVLQGVGAAPFVARPSAVYRLLFLANLRGDIAHAPIHPVRQLGLAPWIEVEFFGYAGRVNRLLSATRA
ncbi:hypothetical protein [Stenotrophomonas sp. ATs4]|uniref:hypothetical protein n=1 Tax=Stenotrophomonas sp. ATs4 TaxID=3402766 RepID=UPI003F6FC500